jgi:hypothetical protein
MTHERTTNPQQFLQDDFGFEILHDMGGTFHEKQISENTRQTLSGGGDDADDFDTVVGVRADSVILQTDDDGQGVEMWTLSEELGIDGDTITTVGMVKQFLKGITL